jgi:hypothetical protein
MGRDGRRIGWPGVGRTWETRPDGRVASCGRCCALHSREGRADGLDGDGRLRGGGWRSLVRAWVRGRAGAQEGFGRNYTYYNNICYFVQDRAYLPGVMS